MNSARRPLSPFLSTYAWRYTFFNPSFIHRGTGVVLAIGLIALCYFFIAIAAGAQSFAQALRVFGHPLFKIFRVVLCWSFLFHLFNGLRHLAWDAGCGFDQKTARLTGRIVFTAATILTLVGCLLMFRHT
jgi:succinate dehydrogenase / fumarate reductase, cytochrome b subunit